MEKPAQPWPEIILGALHGFFYQYAVIAGTYTNQEDGWGYG
jgi:hypothetical protein